MEREKRDRERERERVVKMNEWGRVYFFARGFMSSPHLWRTIFESGEVLPSWPCKTTQSKRYTKMTTAEKKNGGESED